MVFCAVFPPLPICLLFSRKFFASLGRTFRLTNLARKKKCGRCTQELVVWLLKLLGGELCRCQGTCDDGVVPIASSTASHAILGDWPE